MCLRDINLEDIHLNQNPIFIVGYPRSGTTLLQSLLTTQRHVYSLPETHFFSVVYNVIKTDGQGYIEESCLQRVFDAIFEKMRLQFKTHEVERINFWTATKVLKPKHLFEYIVYRYIFRELDAADTTDCFRWLEKTPNHALFLPRIFSVYPNAQCIYVLRHPVPAVYSRKMNFPFNKETPVEILAERWKAFIEGMEHASAQYPDRIYIVKYEDLMAAMETELRRLGVFLKLTFDMDLIALYPSRARHVILPLETWKEKDIDNDFLNTNDTYDLINRREEAQIIEAILKDSMEKYGYNPFPKQK